mgnify:CR=1 FL=1
MLFRSGRVQRVGAMATLFLGDGPVRNFADAERLDTERYGALFRHLLERGIYVAPSLVHGDLAGHNMRWERSGGDWALTGILDWDLASVWDPALNPAYLSLWHGEEKLDAIARDPNNALGIMLSRSPDRAHEVVAMLMKQHQVERDEARKVLETMLDNGLVTRSDVSGVIGRSTAVLTGGATGTPVKLDLDPASVPLPSGDPLEQPLTAEVVADPFSTGSLFESSDFEDEDDEDDL